MNWREQVDGFKSSLKISKPEMSASFIRFGFFGFVGGGKSVTAGKLAIAIAPKGTKILWVDGEGKRSGFAIDQLADLAAAYYKEPKQSIIDRFDVFHVDPPYNPLVAVAAIEHAQENGYSTVILDLLSQTWDSEGGYLDMREEEIDRRAGDDAGKRQRVAASAAAGIKPWTHGKLVSKINSCKLHVILVFQAKNKFNAGTSKPDNYESPIQESGMTRTALAVGCVKANEQGVGGFCDFEIPMAGTKYTHPGLKACLPKKGEQFDFQHGEALARWCACGGSPKALAQQTSQAPPDELKSLKKELWGLLSAIHGGDASALPAVNQHLWDEGYQGDTESWSTLTTDRLKSIIAKVKAKGQLL